MNNELTYELRNEIKNFIDSEFSATPNYLIERAYSFSEGEIENITPYVPIVGDYVINTETNETGEIKTINGDVVIVEVDENEEEWEKDYIVEDYPVYGLPMWGTLWRVCCCFLESYILENLEEVAKAGFQIYQTEDDLYLGIDGAGYDFYEVHWTPLYRSYRKR